MEKIGILGGAFDPIHNGHLHAAQEVLDNLYLDRILLMPTGCPPMKTENGPVTDKALRGEMTRLAAGNHPMICYSDLEIRREGPTYTADTLEELHRLYPEDEFYLILGADQLEKVASWHEAEKVFRLAKIVAVMRNDGEYETMIELAEKLSNLGVTVTVLGITPESVSSTGIREMVKNGQPIDGLVPEAVARFIGENGLYRS